MKPDEEETETASDSRRVAEILDVVLLILGLLILMRYFVVEQRFDAWHTFIGVCILIFLLLRLNAMRKRKGAR
jgi:uncharacterized membrane protein SirB2